MNSRKYNTTDMGLDAVSLCLLFFVNTQAIFLMIRVVSKVFLHRLPLLATKGFLLAFELQVHAENIFQENNLV